VSDDGEQRRVPKGDPSRDGGKFMKKTGNEKPPGRTFEDKGLKAAGIEGKNTTTFRSETDAGKAYDTIPDGVRPNNGPFVEVKSGMEVTLAEQLQAQLNVGRGVELIVRPGANVADTVVSRVGRENIFVFNMRNNSLRAF
jgi:hypothetical protein